MKNATRFRLNLIKILRQRHKFLLVIFWQLLFFDFSFAGTIPVYLPESNKLAVDPKKGPYLIYQYSQYNPANTSAYCNSCVPQSVSIPGDMGSNIVGKVFNGDANNSSTNIYGLLVTYDGLQSLNGFFDNSEKLVLEVVLPIGNTFPIDVISKSQICSNKSTLGEVYSCMWYNFNYDTKLKASIVNTVEIPISYSSILSYSIVPSNSDLGTVNVKCKVKVYYKIQNNVLSIPTGSNDPKQITTVGTLQGATGVYTYQWQSSPDNSPNNWSNVSGATGATLPSTTGIPNYVTYYRRIVNCNGFNPSISNVVSVNQISNNIITESNGVRTFPMNLNGNVPTGGNGVYSYKWQKSVLGVWADIDGAISVSYTIDQAGSNLYSTSYRRVVSSIGAIDSYSNEVLLDVPLSNNSISEYSQFSFEFIGSQPLGKEGVYYYQWQSMPIYNGVDWVDIDGATGKDYLFSTLPSETKKYRRLVTSSINVFTRKPDFSTYKDPYNSQTLFYNAISSNVIKVCELLGTQTLFCGEAFTALKLDIHLGASSRVPKIRWYSSSDGVNFVFSYNDYAFNRNWLPPISNIKMYYRAQIQLDSDIMTTNIVTKDRQILPAVSYVNNGYCVPYTCGNASDKLYVGSMGTLDPSDFDNSLIEYNRGDLIAKAGNTVIIESFATNEGLYFEAISANPCGSTSNRMGDERIVDDLNSLDANLNVYPNPSNGTLFFTMNNKDLIENIKVIGILGETVYESKYPVSGEGSLNLNVPNGTYFVISTVDGKIFKKQIVIQNEKF